MENTKIFAGKCRPGKYPEQFDISFNREDLKKMEEQFGQSGWVNLRLSKSKAGKNYIEVLKPREQYNAIPKTETPPTNNPPESNDLPF